MFFSHLVLLPFCLIPNNWWQWDHSVKDNGVFFFFPFSPFFLTFCMHEPNREEEEEAKFSNQPSQLKMVKQTMRLKSVALLVGQLVLRVKRTGNLQS